MIILCLCLDYLELLLQLLLGCLDRVSVGFHCLYHRVEEFYICLEVCLSLHAWDLFLVVWIVLQMVCELLLDLNLLSDTILNRFEQLLGFTLSNLSVLMILFPVDFLIRC